MTQFVLSPSLGARPARVATLAFDVADPEFSREPARFRLQFARRGRFALYSDT
jgi:hypothetical protein